jgi:hypothetical protein
MQRLSRLHKTGTDHLHPTQSSYHMNHFPHQNSGVLPPNALPIQTLSVDWRALATILVGIAILLQQRNKLRDWPPKSKCPALPFPYICKNVATYYNIPNATGKVPPVTAVVVADVWERVHGGAQSVFASSPLSGVRIFCFAGGLVICNGSGSCK